MFVFFFRFLITISDFKPNLRAILFIILCASSEHDYSYNTFYDIRHEKKKLNRIFLKLYLHILPKTIVNEMYQRPIKMNSEIGK